MTKTPERSQKERLKNNIDLMDELAAGKGRAFIQPGTAKEIAKDLRDLEQRVIAERKSADLIAMVRAYWANPTDMTRRDLAGALDLPVELFTAPDEVREVREIRRHFAGLAPDHLDRFVARWLRDRRITDEEVDDNGIVQNGPFAGAERGIWEGVKFFHVGKLPETDPGAGKDHHTCRVLPRMTLEDYERMDKIPVVDLPSDDELRRGIKDWAKNYVHPSEKLARDILRGTVTKPESAPPPLTLDEVRGIAARLKANNVERPDGMVEIPAHPNSPAAHLAWKIASGTNDLNPVLSIRDDGRLMQIEYRDETMPGGKSWLCVYAGGRVYEAIHKRYAERIVTTGAREDELRRRQLGQNPK